MESEATISNEKGRKFIEEISAMIDKQSIADRCERHLVRSDMVLDLKGQLKKSYEEMIFIQMYRLRDSIRNMIQNHEDVLKALQNVNKRS